MQSEYQSTPLTSFNTSEFVKTTHNCFLKQRTRRIRILSKDLFSLRDCTGAGLLGEDDHKSVRCKSSGSGREVSV